MLTSWLPQRSVDVAYEEAATDPAIAARVRLISSLIRVRAKASFTVEVEGADDFTIWLGLTQAGIDEVHTSVFQLALVYQVVLDAAGSALAQLTQRKPRPGASA